MTTSCKWLWTHELVTNKCITIGFCMNLEELGQKLARVRAHVVREGEGYRRVQPSRDQRARTTTWARKDIKDEWQKDSKMEILMTYPFDIVLLSVSYPFAIPPFCYPFTIHLPSVLGFYFWECKIFINYAGICILAIPPPLGGREIFVHIENREKF